jgi:hypothetical protein
LVELVFIHCPREKKVLIKIYGKRKHQVNKRTTNQTLPIERI